MMTDSFGINICLNDLYGYSEDLYSPWILAVIQGFYESTSCLLDYNSLPSLLTQRNTDPSGSNIYESSVVESG